MLISVAMDPACLRREALGTPEAQSGAEDILAAVTENAVLVAPEIDPFITELIGTVERLGVEVGQDLQLNAAEIAKNPERYVATPPPARVPVGARLDQLHKLARQMRADIVVVPRDEDAAALSGLGRGIEVCTLANYRRSAAERRRRGWRASMPLDRLSDEESAELLGRTIEYATEIVVLDKMIARFGKDGNATDALRRFARGIVYVVRQWMARSPYASYVTPAVRIVTAAGGRGVSGGFVDPVNAEKAIRAALDDTDEIDVLRGVDVTVDLKLEAAPPVFKDRFLEGGGRCWGVSHGFDDIGNLVDPRATRRATLLIPDCQAHRDIVADIRRLPQAEA